MDLGERARHPEGRAAAQLAQLAGETLLLRAALHVDLQQVLELLEIGNEDVVAARLALHAENVARALAEGALDEGGAVAHGGGAAHDVPHVAPQRVAMHEHDDPPPVHILVERAHRAVGADPLAHHVDERPMQADQVELVVDRDRSAIMRARTQARERDGGAFLQFAEGIGPRTRALRAGRQRGGLRRRRAHLPGSRGPLSARHRLGLAHAPASRLILPKMWTSERSPQQ